MPNKLSLQTNNDLSNNYKQTKQLETQRTNIMLLKIFTSAIKLIKMLNSTEEMSGCYMTNLLHKVLLAEVVDEIFH